MKDYLYDPDAAFQRMRDVVAANFPKMTDAQVVHTCNLISNYLRKVRNDIYQVTVSNAPQSNDGYYHHFAVQSGGFTVYCRITVD